MISWVFLGMNESLKPKTKSKAIKKEHFSTQLKYQATQISHSELEIQNLIFKQEKNV